jgi:hypothetical protein
LAGMKAIITRRRLWVIVVGALGVVYLAQAATPLRLDDDTVDYLRMAAAMTDGRTVPTLLPIGFPIVLSMLERAGLGSSLYFVLANCVFLAVGLFAVWRLLASYPEIVRQASIVFSLLAIPFVKSVAMPLPEAAFFCVSLLALWAMTAAGPASGWTRRCLLASAFLCIAASVSIRTIGLALLPAFFLACVQLPPGSPGPERNVRSRGWIIFAGLLAVALIILVWRSEAVMGYQGWLRDYYWQGDVVRQIARRISFVLSGLGEIVVNLPFSRLREWRIGFGVAGVIALVAFVIGSRRARAPLTPVRLYLLTYFLVVAVWPNPSPRLWMPVIPLIIAEAGRVLTELPGLRWRAALVGTYAGWFALTGIAALAYTSRISFSGSNFENVYGRRGGMPTVEVDVTDPNWGHLQYYKAEAKKMITRYGGAERR